MKHYCQNRMCGPFLWKFVRAPILLAVLSTRLSATAFAQIDTVSVPSDVPPGEGNLNSAVEAAIDAGALSNTVFALEPYGYYILTRTITIPAGEHLTIVAPEPGKTQQTAPPQIVWSSNIALFKYNFIFECYGDITLKNVWLLYANTEGHQLGANIQIKDDSLANASGKGEVAAFENVIFDYSSVPPNASGAVGVAAKHFKGTFKNCYFKNCTDPHFRYYGRAVSFPFNSAGWHIDSLRFENCTFANIGYVYSQEGNWVDERQYADNIHFNHCTFFNVVMFTLESGWWYKMSVTNSAFVNTFMSGDQPAQRFNGSEGEPHGGTVRIDSVASFGFEVPFTDQDRRILFVNNSYFTEKWLSDWMYENPASVWWRQSGQLEYVPQPQPMLSAGTLKFFDSADFPYMNAAHLYNHADPGFILAPTNLEALKTFLYYKWWCSADSAWAYDPQSDLQRFWPMKENLAYTNPTLLAAGMGSFPLGDLFHWFPNEYAQWKAQEKSENNRIMTWLNTGKDPGTVAVNEQTAGAMPSRFALSQSYPNPCNPTTRINYVIPKRSWISLKVYNLFGQEVATLFEGVKQAGEYELTFDARKLASGVYMYQLKAENFLETKKLALLK